MLIYLATPYSNPDPEVRRHRFEVVNEVAARLMEEGFGVFSPISHSHPIEKYMDDDKQTWEFWQTQDVPILKACQAVYVLTVPGWTKSVGVKGEIDHANELGIPVTYINPYDYCKPSSLAELYQ